MKILIIEDDGTIRSILSYTLSQNGHEVACMLLREAVVLSIRNLTNEYKEKPLYF